MHLSGWTEELPRTRGHWRVGWCIEGTREEVYCNGDVELVGEEEQEVVLTLSLLLEWSILGLNGRYFFQVYDSCDLDDFFTI